MNRNVVFKNKYYTHLDIKKDYVKYENMIKNTNWIQKHGFYPFIHYEIIFNKYVYDKDTGIKEKREKKRDIFYSSHIDRFIYQYYGQILNECYDKISINRGINKVATAYRNNLKGRCNIHFVNVITIFFTED